ncbi:radical SAM protein [Candidatus Bathyarchaeota archaeon]|nr:radical SAM protein [Candidatus Bathyarchaeota archaeon]
MAVIQSFDPWKGRLCTCPLKYSLSPYTGCAHACRYCYITAYIPNAFHCRVKQDFIKRLQLDLKRIIPERHISIANSADPYSPPEGELELTRKALQILLGGGFKVQLITKSDLVVRDLDIIRKGNCSVSISITTIDDKVAQRLEPGAPSPKRRLDAIRRLVMAGVPCTIRVDPIIPSINDEKLEEIVKKVSQAGASHLVASTYKAKRDSFNRLVNTFPEFKETLNELYWVSGEQVGRARYLPKALRLDLLRNLKNLAEDFGMTYAVCREGMSELRSGQTCDGSHLIPNRRQPSKIL